MNKKQRDMIEYMSEVLEQEDEYFYDAWYVVKDFVIDALSDESDDPCLNCPKDVVCRTPRAKEFSWNEWYADKDIYGNES